MQHGTQILALGNSNDVRRFSWAFRGLKRAYGGTNEWIKAPLTIAAYRDHLEGRRSIGIAPLNDEGCCAWGAIDIDSGNAADARAVCEEIRDLGVNSGVHLFTSKAKGYHLIIFLETWTPACVVRAVLKEVVREAGIDPRTEVFPKQNNLIMRAIGADGSTAGHFGSYLNLPYFGGAEPGRRVEIDPLTGAPYTLAEFLDRLCPFPGDIPIDPVAAGLDIPGDEAAHQAKAARELDELFTNTYTQGHRRPALVSAANVLRSIGLPEEAVVALLMSWAENHFDPPLDPAEVELHVRGQFTRYGERQPREKWSPIPMGSWKGSVR